MGNNLDYEQMKYITPEDQLRISKVLDYLEQNVEQELAETNINVAQILLKMQVDADIIIVALLRDVQVEVEAFDVMDEEIVKLLEYATQIRNVDNINTKENDYEDYRNVLIIMAKDYRIIVLELATRLYIMRKNKKLNYETKKEFAKTTQNVYVPIAHRLGLGELKSELEELSLYFIDSQMYKKIAHELELKKNERDDLVSQMISELKTIVTPVAKEAVIFGRSKSIYSIFKKTYAKNKTLDDIYDLQAIRIICDNKIECYTILGLIHDKYQPVQGRFKDYIALKKPNLYQSLHTTVVGVDNQIFEIQIRTHEMDEIAERGIAAHWLYKESGNNKNLNDVEEQLHLFRDIIRESQLNEEQLEDLQSNIFEASIYTLTPTGKIIHLPNHATVIDFAYRIHSRVAEQMNGAIVNGKIVSYDYELKNGDIVNIKTKKNYDAPNFEWLEYAKTSNARRKIRSYLKKQREMELKVEIERGEELLINTFKKHDLSYSFIEEEASRIKILSNFSLKRLSDLFYELGIRRIDPEEIISFLTKREEFKLKTISKNETNSKEAIVIDGASGIAKQMARCCSPVYGDNIIGVVVSGVGIKIHRQECRNILHNESLRKMPVKWNDIPNPQSTFRTQLSVYADDRPNLLQETVVVLNKQNVGIENFGSRVKGNSVNMTLDLIVKNTDEINTVIENLKKVRSIVSVERILK